MPAGKTGGRRVIIDCDPGQDDAVMLLLALASPEALDILGITAVAGNVPLALTQRNARLLCALAGRHDVPVYAGCPRPLVLDPLTAESVHGKTGIDGFDVGGPAVPLADGHAVDFIIETLAAAADDAVTLVATGPLTNLATAFAKAPHILPKVREIVVMGGAARAGGNVTPAAEFNIRVDPHAARAVLGCGRPLVMIGLDLTHQVITTPARLAAIGAIGGRAAGAVHAMLSFYDRDQPEIYGTSGAPLHDPCTVAYLLRPDLFSGRCAHVEVETSSPRTLGATTVDFRPALTRAANALWMEKIDADAFYALLLDRLGRLRGAAGDQPIG